MPEIAECTVTECAYNGALTCSAPAITVGDSSAPTCDTYMRADKHRHDDSVIAGVGACKMASCGFNRELVCAADMVHMGFVSELPSCLTFDAH